jgi:hypothetical protein
MLESIQNNIHPRAGMSDEGYIIEFHRVGNAVKVTAMDPVTLTEVSMVGAPGVGDTELTRLVVRKLEYVLAKRGTNPGNR